MPKKSKSRRHHAQRHGPRPPQRSPLVPGAPLTETAAAPAEPAAPGEVDEADEPSAPVAATAPPSSRAGTAAAPAPAPAPGLRRVGRVDPAARRVRPPRTTSTAALFEPLDTEDPAIPFDRVPYVPGDLRRVAVMAGMMIALIIIAAVLVSTLVK